MDITDILHHRIVRYLQDIQQTYVIDKAPICGVLLIELHKLVETIQSATMLEQVVACIPKLRSLGCTKDGMRDVLSTTLNQSMDIAESKYRKLINEYAMEVQQVKLLWSRLYGLEWIIQCLDNYHPNIWITEWMINQRGITKRPKYNISTRALAKAVDRNTGFTVTHSFYVTTIGKSRISFTRRLDPDITYDYFFDNVLRKEVSEEHAKLLKSTLDWTGDSYNIGPEDIYHIEHRLYITNCYIRKVVERGEQISPEWLPVYRTADTNRAIRSSQAVENYMINKEIDSMYLWVAVPMHYFDLLANRIVKFGILVKNNKRRKGSDSRYRVQVYRVKRSNA